MIAALFDADGTLYAAQFGRGLMKYARSHGRRLVAGAYFVSLAPALLLRRLHLGDPELFDRLKIARLGWLFRGWDQAQALTAFRWVTDEFLLATRREHVIRRLQSHQEQGHLVLIASGTFTPSLRLLAKRLDVHHILGTGVELTHGRYTGRVILPILKGADKASQILAYLAEHGLEIDWPASYAYGDSYSDSAMLGLVGHPVAVHPDERLRSLAAERRWELLESG
jgi:HAD superfamily hydrolase (TIGR01490 family)